MIEKGWTNASLFPLHHVRNIFENVPHCFHRFGSLFFHLLALSFAGLTCHIGRGTHQHTGCDSFYDIAHTSRHQNTSQIFQTVATNGNRVRLHSVIILSPKTILIIKAMIGSCFSTESTIK